MDHPSAGIDRLKLGEWRIGVDESIAIFLDIGETAYRGLALGKEMDIFA
jgi:hypothetical protein